MPVSTWPEILRISTGEDIAVVQHRSGTRHFVRPGNGLTIILEPAIEGGQNFYTLHGLRAYTPNLSLRESEFWYIL